MPAASASSNITMMSRVCALLYVAPVLTIAEILLQNQLLMYSEQMGGYVWIRALTHSSKASYNLRSLWIPHQKVVK
jgi:hypothetical protein